MGTPAEYLYRSSAYCDELLAGWPLESAAKVVVTGGTAKAVATHLSSEVIHLASLRCLAVHVLQEGPPDGLKPARRIVFLAGLVILWRVLVRCEASEFYFGKSSIRESMVLRLLRLLDEKRRDELHTTLLLRGTDLEREQRAED
jgi:exopolyphosphatase/pppGpp-phosphohydrolase